MGIFIKKKTGGFSDVIRCDQTNYLVWKWHPNGAKSGELKRETAIRTNSVLRVKTGEAAIFVYKKKDGNNEDYIIGPYDGVLKTKNFPILSSIIGSWYEGDTPFQAEIFFVNLAETIQIKFAIPYFDVFDPRFPDFVVPVAVRGGFTFKIEDYKDFVKKHQLAEFKIDDLKEKANNAVTRFVKDAVANAPAENNIPLVNIESKIDLITEKAELRIKERLSELFGIKVIGLDISAIDVDRTCDDYKELKSVTLDVSRRQTDVNILNYEEQLRIQREEGQYAQHMGTRQTNLGAYETEVKGQIGVAGAEALGKMGENGAGNVNLGSGSGFNPMTIMTGMAVGSVLGQNIAGTMNTVINSAGNSKIPLSLPEEIYYIAIDSKPAGPFRLEQLKQMIANGELTKDFLIWKQGTTNWVKASESPDVNNLFPPDIPTL